MIVLDEAAWLPETLLAARQIGVDSVFIGDTGCTDQSEDITRQVLDGVPLEWHKISYEGIAAARSEILRLAHGKAEWLLMLDADMTVKGELPPEPREADCYHGIVEGSWEYQLPLLIRGSRRWAYRGVTHSYLVAEDGDGDYSEATCDLRIEDRRPGGWRPGKLEEDARLLEGELERNPTDARSSFYLAQTYADLGRRNDALREYGRRATLEGWDQERFVAKLRRARLLCEVDPHTGAGALLEAWHERPIRAEPLYSLARHCRQEGWSEAALLFARQAAKIPQPGDRLFVEANVYEVWIKMELGIAEIRAGDKKLGKTILRKLRKSAKLSEANIEWIDELLEE